MLSRVCLSDVVWRSFTPLSPDPNLSDKARFEGPARDQLIVVVVVNVGHMCSVLLFEKERENMAPKEVASSEECPHYFGADRASFGNKTKNNYSV